MKMLLPRLESYHESLYRKPHSPLSPEKVEQLFLDLYNNQEIADKALAQYELESTREYGQE